jgi:hypothetical protein
MLLAKGPEAEMYDAEYLALLFGAALLLGAALYTAVRLRRTRGAVLLCAGLALAALGAFATVGQMYLQVYLDLGRRAFILTLFAVSALEVTAAVMIVLAVPHLLGRNRTVEAEVEGTA